MSSLHFDLNRPVHLARRDGCFEKAAELLYMPMQEAQTHARMDHVDKALAILKMAENHAFFATLSPKSSNQEQDFLHFLKLIAHNVQSAHAMMQHQSHLEAEEGFLRQFLSSTAEESSLPAMHYRRRADDILQGLWHLLRLAHKPYRELQQADLASLSDGEKQRYKKAYESVRDEIASKFPNNDADKATTESHPA